MPSEADPTLISTRNRRPRPGDSCPCGDHEPAWVVIEQWSDGQVSEVPVCGWHPYRPSLPPGNTTGTYQPGATRPFEHTKSNARRILANAASSPTVGIRRSPGELHHIA